MIHLIKHVEGAYLGRLSQLEEKSFSETLHPILAGSHKLTNQGPSSYSPDFRRQPQKQNPIDRLYQIETPIKSLENNILKQAKNLNFKP